MRRLLLALAALTAWLPGAAAAQAIVSASPDQVGVTIYRAPDRAPGTRMDLGWLEGYALVTEKRTVRVPAGRSIVRFEGVAAGILPESAIVADLPAEVREKNLDADLLSERSLFDRSLNRPVILRRRDGDKVTEERAILRSGPDGAAILQTAKGFEAVNCGKTQDDIVFTGLPEGLSAKPTLSIAFDAPREGTVTMTLAYLAWGFDWQANYVATLRPDGKQADLFAWVTLASSDTVSFPDAQAMVVAGKVKRSDYREDMRWQTESPLSFQCWFAEDRINGPEFEAMDLVLPSPPPAPVMMMAPMAEGISVRAQKVVQEALGDLKLYRVPEPTTVAAMAQKQVALLDKPSVPVDVVYRQRLYLGPPQSGFAAKAQMLLRARNTTEKGLGLALPAGPVAVFAGEGERRLLVGGGAIDDKAVGEKVEIEMGSAPQVTVEYGVEAYDGAAVRTRLTVRNANDAPAAFEAPIALVYGGKLAKASARLEREDGQSIWRATIPANGSATLTLDWRP